MRLVLGALPLSYNQSALPGSRTPANCLEGSHATVTPVVHKQLF